MKFAIFFLLSTLSVAHAEVNVQVLFKPLPPDVQPQEAAIRLHIITATQDWASHFQTKDCTITLQFSIQPWPARGTGRSFVSAPYRDEVQDGRHVSEEGAAQKIRTGRDANGADPDIEMYFDPAYFRTLWFDPDPKTRKAPIPARMLDAYSVILHELGHAFGFNGFRDQKSGRLPGEWMSVYDRWVTFDGRNFFFDGPSAMKLYGHPIPLAHSNNNYHHIAEKGETSDPKLTTDLMNGIVLQWGRRYSVSALDVAILSDCGLKPKE